MSNNWIAVDWGTTNLRVWVMNAAGTIVASHQSDNGMGSLDQGDFEPALLSIVEPYLSEGEITPIICCGMVGAKQGWVEAPYQTVPCETPNITQSAKPTTRDPRIDVKIIPGVCQTTPADVMRGEETQIRGYLAKNPKFDGVLCLPGTHTKWVHVSASEIVSFRTFMTGELFSLLSSQSVLRHGLGGASWDWPSFKKGVADAIGRPQSMAADLFSLRADGLLNNARPEATKSRLSGLLVGLELAGSKPYWLGQRIVIIGAPELSKVYQSALEEQGAMVECEDGAELSLAGIVSAYFETPTAS